jgi:CheY-like chemotaxis protein
MSAEMSDGLQFASDQAVGNLPRQTRGIPEPLDGSQVRSILIVDDSDFERNVMRGAVESLTKFRVCGQAANGVEAVQRALELRPDLVVMDLAMPLMNGVEAAMVLRNTMPKVPIVLFTLYAEQLRGAISPGFGVTLIVSKTDGLAALLESLERLLAEEED